MAMIHAENADCIEWLTKRLEAAGRTAPRFHAHARPMLVEREATHRAIALAELVDVPILIVHVSGREAVEQIRWARAQGLKVFAETCPQYLFLTAGRPRHRRQLPRRALRLQPAAARQGEPGGDLERPERRPVHRLLLRPRAVPLRRARRARSPAARKSRSATSRTASRASRRGCRCCIPKACSAGRMTLNRFVELTSTNPAKAYGLHPRKGTIAVGSDADLVIWDEREFVLTQRAAAPRRRLHALRGHDACSAWPGVTIARGEVVWDGQLPRPRRPRPLPALRRAVAAARPAPKDR